MHKRRVAGFTIVELAAVIVVIAILAAIILVSYGESRKRANDTAVQSDVSQIADALNVYYSDNGTYPIDQTAFLTVTSAKVSLENYATSANAMLYCVDTNASSNGRSMALIGKSISGKSFYVKDEGAVAEFSGSFPPGGSPNATCQAANSAIATVTAVWVHQNGRSDSAGVSANGWLVNVL